MLKLKQSLIAFAGLSLLIGLVALVAPARIRGQGNGGNQQPLNVNVINTPDVNVANTVRVSSLPVEPFNERAQLSFSDGETIKGETVFTVPVGKQLVVTYASASANVPAGQEVRLAVRGGSSSDGVLHYLKPVGSASQGFVASEPLQFRLDAGRFVDAIVTRSSAAGGGGAAVSISGYLVDVP